MNVEEAIEICRHPEEHSPETVSDALAILVDVAFAAKEYCGCETLFRSTVYDGTDNLSKTFKSMLDAHNSLLEVCK